MVGFRGDISPYIYLQLEVHVYVCVYVLGGEVMLALAENSASTLGRID